MKIMPAAIFVCVGIWVTYNYPDFAETIYIYILSFLDWAAEMISSFQGDKKS